MDRLFQNDEKLPYLHLLTIKKSLISNEKMGLCLYMSPVSPVFNTKITYLKKGLDQWFSTFWTVGPADIFFKTFGRTNSFVQN